MELWTMQSILDHPRRCRLALLIGLALSAVAATLPAQEPAEQPALPEPEPGSTVDPRADINRDGVVDVTDLALFGQAYGQPVDIPEPTQPWQIDLGPISEHVGDDTPGVTPTSAQAHAVWMLADVEADRRAAEAATRQVAALETISAQLDTLNERIRQHRLEISQLADAVDAKAAEWQAVMDELLELFKIAQEASERNRDQPPTLDEPIDINSASAIELQALPGIGPALSARIVAARPFLTFEGLLDVSGIGPTTLEEIKPHIVLADPPPAEETQ